MSVSFGRTQMLLKTCLAWPMDRLCRLIGNWETSRNSSEQLRDRAWRSRRCRGQLWSSHLEMASSSNGQGVRGVLLAEIDTQANAGQC